MNEGLTVSEMDFEALSSHEWLAVNAIGGYASSTVAMLNTRRYHGLLVAAMAPPVRRMVLLSRLEEVVRVDGRESFLACNRYPGTVWPRGHEHLRAFSTDPFPRWAYQGDGWTLLKQLRLVPGENTVLLSYTLLGGDRPVELELRPLLALRGIHDLSYQWNGRLVIEQRSFNHWRVAPTSRTPEVFFAHEGAFDRRPNWYLNSIYTGDQARGYAGLEDLWSPGAAYVRIVPGQTTHFACSADPIELDEVAAHVARVSDQARVSALVGATCQTPARPGESSSHALPPSHLRPDPTMEALCRAASAFVLSRPRVAAPGDSLGCTVAYPWNTPSPRPALIAFAGLMLAPGRFDEARTLLLTLVDLLEDGLLPSAFPEDGSAPIYAGADVSLWFINAVHQYLAYTGDEATVRSRLLPAAQRILLCYRRGAGLGISVDADGLLAVSAPGIGATWMDAKVGDWVVTPRAGRPVEINALWYNALAAVAEITARLAPTDEPAGAFDPTRAWLRPAALRESAEATRQAFNRRFWNESARCCYDVVGAAPGGHDDASVRPNQLLAASLPFPVLAPERIAFVVRKVCDELLTPVGVRTLSPRDPGYQGRYAGNVLARDRAYHNGSAFPWLLGPLATAMIRSVRVDESASSATLDDARARAGRLLEPILRRLNGAGVGQLGELFDGDAPHHPGGAIASPLSVGELLRCYAEDLLGRLPAAAAAASSTTGQAVPPTMQSPA